MRADEVRVLVVDDVEDVATSLAMVLSMDGYQVRTALNSQAALEAVQEFNPLCVLMDIQMPGGDGHELCRRIRAQHGDDIVLVAVTGTGDEADLISEGFSHFDHCLRKPLDPGHLRKILPRIGV